MICRLHYKYCLVDSRVLHDIENGSDRSFDHNEILLLFRIEKLLFSDVSFWVGRVRRTDSTRDSVTCPTYVNTLTRVRSGLNGASLIHATTTKFDDLKPKEKTMLISVDYMGSSSKKRRNELVSLKSTNIKVSQQQNIFTRRQMFPGCFCTVSHS